MSKYCTDCKRAFYDGTYLYCPFCKADLVVVRLTAIYKPPREGSP